MLEPQRFSPVAGIALEYKFGRGTPAQVFRASHTAVMFFDAPGYVGRDPRVQAAVNAAQDIQSVGHRLTELAAPHALS